jgi:signal transduction histidine kinase
MIVQNMRSHRGNPEYQEAAVEDIAAVTDQMRDLMRRLSELRKGESMANNIVELDRMVEETLAALQVGQHDGLVVTTRLETDGGVRGDETLLRRVVENLVTNAVHATNGTGTLEVITESQPVAGNGGFKIVLSIKDTGAGMDEEFIREKLFRPFATTKKKGLGLGLYQCRSIVRAHQGEILVNSSPGEGTVFRVILPGIPLPASRQGEKASEAVVGTRSE